MDVSFPLKILADSINVNGVLYASSVMLKEQKKKAERGQCSPWTLFCEFYVCLHPEPVM